MAHEDHSLFSRSLTVPSSVCNQTTFFFLQVHETARQVANAPVSANLVPYDQMKSQCEALVMEKQQKMSVLLSFKHSRTDSRGSTAENGLETNEACSSWQEKKNLSITTEIFENVLKNSSTSCCSHLLGLSLRRSRRGRSECDAATRHQANLTGRSGCHLQAHMTSSWELLGDRLVQCNAMAPRIWY